LNFAVSETRARQKGLSPADNGESFALSLFSLEKKASPRQGATKGGKIAGAISTSVTPDSTRRLLELRSIASSSHHQRMTVAVREEIGVNSPSNDTASVA